MSVNKVILVGRLGNDPEVRSGTEGRVISTVSIGTNSVWNDKSSGERREETEWHRVVFFNRLAEIARDYLRKGTQVYVEGRLKTRKYQDNQGVDRYTTEVIADNLQMLGSKGDSDGQRGSRTDGGYSREPYNPRGNSNSSSGSSYAQSQSKDDSRGTAPNYGSSSNGSTLTDDIPF
ncbi:single-stranded DNA-binding protein [Taylorella equigenitalis]|uniref:single-stranded DNA-binding protein n=1 Tax=Taylorella equigenitalis TaxID=29575 RepID=UPI0004140C47|nr:single-stranded DNA-binding protein [Taylorella equigenitalis]RBA26935.1 single-stranded DNA-binding protein [Taylorella equigenitalis]WDU46292.1 single-stranded DNA-binding protein [Taylorella equigenitalis]WDU47776.1 single-stranded DNA-binding protein [Taylorella equigenitalis]WDU51760.1 single-stranded DNA-binding protein [Taylorella equigenitalis]WDU53267.1 single-stranded DNA-binding protein [Taylorella equigenitalis]